MSKSGRLAPELVVGFPRIMQLNGVKFMELILIMGYPFDFLDQEKEWFEEKRKDDDRKIGGYLANGKR